MIVKRISYMLLGGMLSVPSLWALTLKQSVSEVIQTNPVVQERLKNFRATQQDLGIAKSEFYPSVDLRAAVGYTQAGDIKSSNPGSDWNHYVNEIDYSNYESALTITQNLFDGFGTLRKIDYQHSRILAAAYNYVETTNDIAFKMTSAYLEVVKSYELLQTAKENVQINEEIYVKVKDLYDSGLTTDSEVKKIQSSLSLARSNLTVQLTKAREAEYSFRRLLGRMPKISEMQRPTLDVAMPESIEKAALYAINHNPSLIVSRYNIEGAKALYAQNKKEFYPKIDLEVSQTFNDQDKANTGFNSPDDRFRVQLVLNYNLFKGGADSANAQKLISQLSQEVEKKRDLKRQVIEGLDLSWNSYEMIQEQLKDLRAYKKFSEETLELYKEEYDLGRRSLLDLLSSQNDTINARSQIITAEYALLSAKYRILDAMGLLPLAILDDTSSFLSRVNLYGDESEGKEVLDTLPVKLDADNDTIVDSLDLCDNSLKDSSVMPYGCVKMKRDGDGDGIEDDQDSCPMTPKGAKVNAKGCALDADKDGVKDYKDQCLDTPAGYQVDENGCASSTIIRLGFTKNSVKIPADAQEKVQEFASFLQKHPEVYAEIIGHTSRVKGRSHTQSLKISQKRAQSLKAALVKLGINADRLSTDGRGETEPIADDATVDGRRLNQRLEILLSK